MYPNKQKELLFRFVEQVEGLNSSKPTILTVYQTRVKIWKILRIERY